MLTPPPEARSSAAVRPAAAQAGLAAWDQDSGERQPEHGSGREPSNQQSGHPAHVGADGQQVTEAQHESGEAGVVQEPPLPLADPPPDAEGERQHEH